MFSDSILRRLAAICCALIAVSCATQTPPVTTTGATQVVDAAELPAPTKEDIIAGDSTPLAPLDIISVVVFNVPELTLHDIQVDSSGFISIPLVGAVFAAGKTPGQLAMEIEEGLRGQYVRNPQVAINLREMGAREFSIDGAVKQPGRYQATGRTSLMDAVAQARGLSETAKVQHVVVFRTVANQQMAALYNLGAIRQGYYEDPRIYPEDVILVGESATRRLYRDGLQLLPTLASPIILLLQNN